jgi:flagellar protein FliO/FliZ
MVNPPLTGEVQTLDMGFAQIVQMIAALAVTLGLFGLGVVAMRRFAPGAVLRLRPPAERRLQVIESLMLDPSRRLVLVRFDAEERLILLGEGRMLAARPAHARVAASEAGVDA